MINNDLISKKEKKSINWLYSAAINLAVLALILALTDIVYETNDDFAISQMLYDGYPYVRFVNYFMSQVIIFFQGFFPGVNMFMLSQIVLAFISFTVLVKVFLDRRDNNIEIAVLTIPKAGAARVAGELVSYGIKGIWNFAHIDLNVPDNIEVENVHLSESLMRLSYNISKKKDI